MVTSKETPQLAIGPAASAGSERTARMLGQLVSNDEHGLLSESLSTLLADLLARMHDIEPTDGRFQLYNHVDPDALDDLFQHAQSHDAASWRFELDVGEETIVIDSDGYVSLD